MENILQIIKVQPESKTGTISFVKLSEMIRSVYDGAFDVKINQYSRGDSFDCIFKILKRDEFCTEDFYRLTAKDFKELICIYLKENHSLVVKKSQENEIDTAHIYFDQNVIKFRYI